MEQREVCISYSHQDRERISVLAQALESEGIQVWWNRDLEAGQDWENELFKELDNIDCIIAAWSPASIYSEWVLTEAGAASTRGVLVPVVLEPCELPEQFAKTQAIDLTQWFGDREAPAFIELARTIMAVFSLAEQKDRLAIKCRDLAASLDGANMESIIDCAAEGQSNAQYLLGVAFRFGGGGLDMDYEQAKDWLLRAAAQGNTDSYYWLGDIYAFNPDEVDLAEAMKWYELGAEAGDAEAAYSAYEICAVGGIGVQKNLVLAQRYLEKAAQLGSGLAREELAQASA